MIRETHEKLRPVLERRDHGFRWRGTEISRIEGLSDAVFAVAVTLLVVSLEAPKTFGDLTRLMHGFVSFGYVYPLKFLFTVFTNGITGYRETDASGHAIHAMQPADWRPLMEIYSAGFMALYVIFALLYWHAYRLRSELDLSPLESYETRGVVQENVLMIAIGTLALVLAFLNLPKYSGMSYALIGPLQTWLGFVHGRRRKELAGVSG